MKNLFSTFSQAEMTPTMISFADIEAAYTVLQPIVHATPVLTSRSLNSRLGNQVFLKAENFQRAGAFKIRGAYNKISSLTPEERRIGVIAHSSGNHAQGVSLAASLLDTKATIVMPGNSPGVKVRATQSYGGTVIFCDDTSDDRERVARQLQNEYGYILVPPFDDDKIIAGQGTVVLEVAKQLSDIDAFFLPVGGGGLIAGCAIAAKHFFPRTKVIGVETEAANDCQQSYRRKEIVKIAPPKTIADGMRTQAVGVRNFEIIKQFVDDIVTVTDEQVIAMMQFFARRMKIIVEPTGAVAPAAVFFDVLGMSGKRICAVISGGNAEPSLLRQWL
jgi:threonine dehydratase